MAGDGQVTLGDVVLKHGARKIRTLQRWHVLAGFAGAVADALTLFENSKPSSKRGTAICAGPRSSWPRNGGPIAICAGSRRSSSSPTPDSLLLLSGDGDVIEPDDGIAAIGSGAPYATAAAARLDHAHRAGRPRNRSSRRWGSPPNFASTPTDHFTIEWISAIDEVLPKRERNRRRRPRKTTSYNG